MPSLYEFTTPVGDVASSDFTTLYNASGLTVPNAGAGAVSGNLNVGGNLTVQGTSLLIGAVTLQSTLCLPNYCFPLPDGTTNQIIATDGSGNLYWTNVGSLPGATYTIQADTATGGANLTLADSAGGTDSVKFAGGTNVTVTRTDASTITISTVADNIPDGTAAGQVLTWDGTAWTADNVVTATSTGILTAEFQNNTTTAAGSFAVRRNTGSSAYTTATDSFAVYQFDSNSQAVATVGAAGFSYSTTNPGFGIITSTNNFSTSTTIGRIDSTDVKFNGTNLVLNFNHSGAPSSNASITVERGSSTDATITWNESTDKWQFSNNVSVTGTIEATGVISTTAESIGINTDSTNTDSLLNFKGVTQYLKWNDGDSRFEFSDPLFITNSVPSATFERQTTQAATAPSESKNALKLLERVTDAGSNATDDGGTGVIFGRTSGVSGGTEVDYLQIGANYFGTTNTAEYRFNWSNDNFTESPSNVFPGTYTLLRLGSNDSSFLNNSIFVNYSAAGPTKTATSITGGNTLVFSSAHGFSAGDRIKFTSTTQNGLTQNNYYYVLATGLTSTQCRVGLTVTGSAVALTNGTGLTLVFATLVNYVGINTNTPSYTLDVNGDANVSGDIYISGYQIDINSPQAGQAIVFDGTKFVNNNEFEFTNATYRPSFINDVSTTSITAAEFLRRRTSLTSGQSVAQLMGQIVGTTETYTHRLVSQYDSTGNNQFVIQIDPVGNFTVGSTTISSQLAMDNDNLFIKAPDITLLSTVTGAPSSNATLTVNRGSSTDTSLRWNESTDRWQFTNNGTTFYNMVINIDDLNDVTITNPAVNGDLLTYDATSGQWVNRTFVKYTSNTNRTTFINASGATSGTPTSATVMLKDTIGTAYANGDGSGVLIGLINNGTNETRFASYTATYESTGDHAFLLRKSTDNFATSTTIAEFKTSGSTLNSNLNVVGDLDVQSVVIDNIASIDTGTVTTTSTATVTIANTTRNVLKAVIYITDTTTNAVHTVEALALRSGATALLTTYGEMYSTAALATFSADISSGSLRIRATPASSNSTDFSVVRTSLT